MADSYLGGVGLSFTADKGVSGSVRVSVRVNAEV